MELSLVTREEWHFNGTFHIALNRLKLGGRWFRLLFRVVAERSIYVDVPGGGTLEPGVHSQPGNYASTEQSR